MKLWGKNDELQIQTSRHCNSFKHHTHTDITQFPIKVWFYMPTGSCRHSQHKFILILPICSWINKFKAPGRQLNSLFLFLPFYKIKNFNLKKTKTCANVVGKQIIQLKNNFFLLQLWASASFSAKEKNKLRVSSHVTN